MAIVAQSAVALRVRPEWRSQGGESAVANNSLNQKLVVAFCVVVAGEIELVSPRCNVQDWKIALARVLGRLARATRNTCLVHQS